GDGRGGPPPVELVTDRAPVYPRVVDELAPAARHVAEQYENNAIESDHGRLKARLRPMRGLKRLASRLGATEDILTAAASAAICSGPAGDREAKVGEAEVEGWSACRSACWPPVRFSPCQRPSAARPAGW